MVWAQSHFLILLITKPSKISLPQSDKTSDHKAGQCRDTHMVIARQTASVFQDESGHERPLYETHTDSQDNKKQVIITAFYLVLSPALY